MEWYFIGGITGFLIVQTIMKERSSIINSEWRTAHHDLIMTLNERLSLESKRITILQAAVIKLFGTEIPEEWQKEIDKLLKEIEDWELDG